MLKDRCCVNYSKHCVTLTDRFSKMIVLNQGGFVMLRSMKQNKKYFLGMVTIGLFGILGLLLAPVVIYIVKLSKRYPKVFRWILFTTFLFIGIYGFLFEKDWHTSLSIICIGAVIAVSGLLNTNSR